MKNIIFILVTCFTMAGYSQEIRSHLTKLNLKGKIKSVKETQYKVIEKFGETIKVKSRFFTWMFNEKGNIMEEKENNFKYKYDEKGNLMEKDRYSSDGSFLDYKHTYTYDEKGNMIEENGYDNAYAYSKGILDYQSLHKYDEKGNLIEKNRYDSRGNLNYKDKYDKKGSKIETSYYDSEDRLAYKSNYTYKYDPQGNWIIQTEYGNNKSVIIEREIEYY